MRVTIFNSIKTSCFVVGKRLGEAVRGFCTYAHIAAGYYAIQGPTNDSLATEEYDMTIANCSVTGGMVWFGKCRRVWHPRWQS